MNLSNEIISQFVKATKDNEKTSVETTVYGTTVDYNGRVYVKLDGSDLLTPVSTTTDVKSDERVTVMIKDHTATITGNISSPAARTDDVKEIGSKITEVEVLVADKVSTKELEAESARIDTIVSENVIIKEKLTASEAEIDNLVADNVTINGALAAQYADIIRLETEKLSANAADIKFATIENLDAINANLHNLESTYGEFRDLTADRFTAIEADIRDLDVDKLSAELADLKYANIDFSNIGAAAVEKLFSESGIIKDLVMSDGVVTGELVGVTIKGDIIEGGTVKADKLVVKGSDGLYYKLNVEAGATTSEEVSEEELQNGLHGTAIIAKTITAEKISVDDLVAFDATIAGLNMTSGSIYSGVKESVDNTTRGFYMDRTGQMALGDSNNFIKYYKDSEGQYKLEISAGSVVLQAHNKNLEEVIEDITVGGKNLIRNSITMIYRNYYFEDVPEIDGDILTDENGDVLLDESDKILYE